MPNKCDKCQSFLKPSEKCLCGGKGSRETDAPLKKKKAKSGTKSERS
jgi:hypothetical protein